MLSFDERPFSWLLVSGCGLALVLGLGAWNSSKKAPFPLPEWPFVLSGLSLLTWARLPVLLFNRELNPDESQMISHAITLAQWPVYWQSVDGTTIGPLDLYALLLPRLLGLGFDYTAARVLGLGCIAASLAFLFGSLRAFFGASVARVAWLPALLFLSFTQVPDFVHYSSEHVPLVLLGGAVWLFARSVSEKNTPLIRAFGIGLLLGMVPFGKLQGVPPAGVVAVFALVLFWQRRQLRQIAFLLVGGLTFPVLALGLCATFGVLDDFWTFYIVGNLQYGTNQSLFDSLLGVIAIWGKSTYFRGLAVVAVFLLGLHLFQLRRYGWVIKSGRFVGAFIALSLLATGYAILKSGFPFTHYLHWLVAPLTLLNGWILSYFLTSTQRPLPRLAGYGLTTALLVLAPLLVKLTPGRAYNAYLSNSRANRALPQSAVSRTIGAALPPGAPTQPGAALVVWGWQCKYYVETQLPAGTAENHTERCIFPIALRDTYRRRLLSDMQRTRPLAFVDAVGKQSWWVQDRATQGHECFPELAAYVRREYTYAGLVEDSRIYVRTERRLSVVEKTTLR